jgi:hypothetical protein
MNYTSTSLTNLKKLTEDYYALTHSERLYFIKVGHCIEYLNIIIEEFSIINYTTDLYLRDFNNNNLFKTCNTLDELKDTIVQIIKKKNIVIDAKDKKR